MRAPQDAHGLHHPAWHEQHDKRESCAVKHESQIAEAAQDFGQDREQIAPNTGPISVPMPPTITMARTVKDSVMVKASGTSVPTNEA